MNMSAIRKRARVFCRKDLLPLLIMALVLFAIRSSLADWNDVPTGSMKPTILEGDRLFVNKLAYDLKVPFTTWHIAQWDNPRRGDIVVFYSPHDGKRLVKRVIGLPGDTLAMHDNVLFVNGRPLDYQVLPDERLKDVPETDRKNSVFATEQLTSQGHAVAATPSLPSRRTFGPYRVPEGSFFMMGDNRDNSFDSRYWGPVERSRILGRATSVVLSVDLDHHYLPRWHRFLTSLDH